MDKNEMAALFDIDLNEQDQSTSKDSSDYSTTAEDRPIQQFSEKVADMRAFMEPELDNQIINKAIQDAASSPAVLSTSKPKAESTEPDEVEDDTIVEDDENDIPGDIVNEDFSDEVQKDMKEFEVTDDEEKLEISESTFQDASPEVLDGPDIPNEIESNEDIPNSSNNDSNPLGLSTADLKIYEDIKNKYPMFTLYDGSVTFRDFYQFKFQMLKSLFGRFKTIDIKSTSEEVSNVNLDHFIGDAYISADLLQRKIDQSYQARVRLSSILVSILEQQPAWARWCEMLRSKLWKDHDLKGAHRRDGLTIEHMSDVEDYVETMRGLLESVKHVDQMLKAAAESLSRQLTCVQIKQPTGFISESSQQLNQHTTSNKLDDFDDIEIGTSIGAPKSDGKPTTIEFGAGIEVDDLSTMG